MIERQIIAQRLKEKMIEEFVFKFLGHLSCSHIKIQKTPLGERITVYTSRPGLIVGKRGANIKELTAVLKSKFKMENPQIEVAEIDNPDLDAATIVRGLINSFQRFGPKRFKAMAYRVIENTMRSGAKGVEIVIAGRGVPGERAKTWRFCAGYLKKSGDVSAYYVDRAYEPANLKSGSIGIKVSVLHPDVALPDDITIVKQEILSQKQENEAKVIKKVSEKKKLADEKKSVVGGNVDAGAKKKPGPSGEENVIKSKRPEVKVEVEEKSGSEDKKE